VDGLGTVNLIKLVGQSWQMKVAVAESLQKYIAEKGSICIDGVSLTVNAVDKVGFEVNIIPHTLQETIIQHYQTGSQVNLEVDLIARYLERLLPQQSGITMETLVKNGFIK
jgi:riboflavin synthase